MAIKKIRIANFKSFKELEIELGKFNVLIGANASGKSNFIHIFEFLRDIINHSLDDAISIQGDVKYFRNINIGPSKDFSLEVFSDDESTFPILGGEEDELTLAKIHEWIYKFSTKFYKKKSGFRINEDKLHLKCKFLKYKKREKKINKSEIFGEGEVILFINDEGKIELTFNKSEKVIIEKDQLWPFLPLTLMKKMPPKTIFLEYPLIAFMSKVFKDISIYNFDPKQLKKAVAIGGKTELEDNGSNIAIVLKKIKADKEKRRKFSNLIRDVLSFVDNLDVEKFAGRSLFVKLRETYSPEKFLPAFSISDGTLNMTALIIALYFEKQPLIIIEEPERNIHPYLISKIIDMMKDVSKEKQIIITTHNPEILKHVSLEDILLISRDKEGFSKICRPAEKEEIKIFLKNQIGIDELYVKNLLGI